jgi:hypothetical protein
MFKIYNTLRILINNKILKLYIIKIVLLDLLSNSYFKTTFHQVLTEY